jgi:hypothetical protein
MLCALTVRQLKPGTFEQFAEEFGPPESEGRLGAGCGSTCSAISQTRTGS